MEDEALAAFQALLLEALADGDDPSEAVHAIRSRPESEAYRDWIDRWDPRMVAVAMGLVRRWGRIDGVAPGSRIE